MVPSATHVLRFAASFLWADLELVDTEKAFLTKLARELGVDDVSSELRELFERPPAPEDVDPMQVSPATADLVRRATLRAIAADGRVDPTEMALFDLLDELLPREPVLDACA